MDDKSLELIRDEVGETPDDDTLFDMFEALGHWLPVAIRVLKRRYAALSNSGNPTSFSLDGVLSVGLGKGDLKMLADQISRLETQWANLGTKNHRVGKVYRTDR